MITSPLHLLHINPTTGTRPRRPSYNRSNSSLLAPQTTLIPILVFLACEPGMPRPLVDVAHLVAAGVAEHELLAGGVDLA